VLVVREQPGSPLMSSLVADLDGAQALWREKIGLDTNDHGGSRAGPDDDLLDPDRFLTPSP
jgi:hypothetical protein